ncbi:type I glyceraldehyde-3-phosphate dehydrogenase [Candidatus Gottesmanbacteria bacterium]|nr:type I glyceraldehyde-3-phosphate dehydrogenase [Candidatus Gottesmanbacteria bacterium]
MKILNIGINGFGRIGRIASRIILTRKNLQLAAINSRASTSSHAYLLKYDSTYGTIPNIVESSDNLLKIDKQKVDIFNVDNPVDIPWDKSGVDIVIDATGKFRETALLLGHLRPGVKFVVLSAPAKDVTKTYVLGVNNKEFDPKVDKIISNSSCTTNALATTLKVLHDNFRVKHGFMTTTPAVTDSQNLLDNSHKKEVRLRRASIASMIPASTGSAKDIGKLFPELSGKIICQAIRVPLLTVSLINLTVTVNKKVSKEMVNNAFTQASKTNLAGILSVANEELVSKDYTGNPHSAIVDPFLTAVTAGNLVNVYAWYDNEWGYTSRLVDMVEFIGRT